MTQREHLYALVATLPEGELTPATRFLEYLHDRREDPVLTALAQAPLDDEPLSAEDQQALEEAFADRTAGRVLSHEEIRRSVLGSR